MVVGRRVRCAVRFILFTVAPWRNICGLKFGASEILLTQEGAQLFGSWVQIYQKGVPLVLMVVTLLLFPQGLVSVRWRRNLGSTAQAFRRTIIWLGRILRSSGGK